MSHAKTGNDEGCVSFRLRTMVRTLDCEQGGQVQTRDTSIPTRLPAAALIGAHGPLPLRAPEQGSRVLLLVRDDAHELARPYIGALEQRLPELRDWYANALVVTEQELPD